jgi:AcrR family transcriptional regulator
VGRWAPDARARLETAALDLFVEHGYEETTVAQIAERAGLNRATFFRHFADKREVLFAGEDVLAGLFADAIRAAPPRATLIACLQAALAAVGDTMTPQRRATARRRILILAADSELHERGQLKYARITSSIADALRERGRDDLTARLAADLGLLAFRVAFERWMKAGEEEPFPPFAVKALNDLQTRAAEFSDPVTNGERTHSGPHTSGRSAASATST